MRQYSFLQAIPLSFYSKALYRDVYNWTGFGFLYVFCVLCLSSLPVALYFTVLSFGVGTNHAADIDYVVQQVPRMVFKNGELSVDVPQPYYIRAPKMDNKQENLAIIDTTRNVNEWNKPDFRGIIFGKTQALVRSKANESRLHDYPDNINHIVTSEDVRHWVDVMLSWLWLLPWVTLPFVLPLFFVYRIIQLFINGLMGIVIANFTGTSVTYTQSVRLASVALTPVIVTGTALGYLLHIQLWWIFYVALATGYLWFAMKANSSHA